MSSTYINTRITTETVQMEALRRKEAEAREAQRREMEAREAAAREVRRREEAAHQAQLQQEEAARKAAEQEARRREAEAQAIRQRIAKARAAIAAQDQRYQAAVNGLDQARARLPDLQLATPPFPDTTPDGIQTTPETWEAHAVQVERFVMTFERTMAAAIRAAECQLERRRQLAATYLAIDEVCAEAGLRLSRMDTLAQGMGVSVGVRPLEQPSTELDLETAQTVLAGLRVALAAIQDEEIRLQTQWDTNQRVQALSGTAAAGASADRAYADYLHARQTVAGTAMQHAIEHAMQAQGLQEESLPTSLHLQLQHLIASATEQDGREHARMLLAREASRQRGIAKANALMTQVPGGVADDPDLAQRWAALAGRLQRVAAGQEMMVESIEREYAQLRQNAQHRVGGAYALADWVKALHQAGIQALATEDESRWILLDNSVPGSWILATLYDDQDGTLNVKTELFMDENVPHDAQADAQAVASTCAKLQQAAHQTDSKVGAAAQEIEREPRLHRKRRPQARAAHQPAH